MVTRLFYTFLIIALTFFNTDVYATACSPSTTNGSCATTQALTPGAPCVNGTTCGGNSGVGGSACIPAGYGQCSWYSFVATATSMYVQVVPSNAPSCFFRSNVYRRGATACSGTEVSCISGAPWTDVHSLTGLTIGATYDVQVCYNNSGSCGNDGKVDFCIEVGVPDPPCDQCTNPCGTALGYPTTPTIPQVVADCNNPDFKPVLYPADGPFTFCNEFIAVNSTVNFNVIITSNCAGGNVTNFSWSLFNSPSCGAAIQTGTLASLTFTGLTVGNSYVFCYTFDVPATCTHTKHCPFFVGSAPLPINLLSFTANSEDNSSVNLDWVTESEINNDFFTIERTLDGKIFEVIGELEGAGNSNVSKYYQMIDKNPYQGRSYYRLKQTDFDGNFTYSDLVTVNIHKSIEDLIVFPNPVTGNGNLSFNSAKEGDVDVLIYDVSGRKVFSESRQVLKGTNSIQLAINNLNKGMYFISLKNGQDTFSVKFIKD
ncbi:MAG: T9SS type A sorting domain-containing protein [Vicingaceae bacterium]|nr:T9SS type A sorting domain-containing protein [Vicingaceae bacterium]